MIIYKYAGWKYVFMWFILLLCSTSNLKKLLYMLPPFLNQLEKFWELFCYTNGLPFIDTGLQSGKEYKSNARDLRHIVKEYRMVEENEKIPRMACLMSASITELSWNLILYIWNYKRLRGKAYMSKCFLSIWDHKSFELSRFQLIFHSIKICYTIKDPVHSTKDNHDIYFMGNI